MNTYYIILGVIVAIAGILYLFFKKRNSNTGCNVVLIGTIILLFLVNINLPRLVTVEGCDDYTEGIILLPTEILGIKTTYGRATYILNNSEQPIGYEYVFYGSNQAKEGEDDALIMPNEVHRAKGITIDYIFTEPESSVRTKSSGDTKTHLLCLSLEDFMEESEE